jgi:ABC-type transport system involved in multi-copper enzyme maturation permease subunit
MGLGAIVGFELKNLRKSFLGFLFLLMVFNILIFSVYNESLEGAFEAIPENMRGIFGGNNIFTFNGFLSFMYFGWEWVLTYGFYLLSKSANAIAGDIKNGSIDIYLSKPRSRIEYVVGKWCAHVIMTMIAITISIIFAFTFISNKFGLDTDKINMEYLLYTFIWQFFIVVCVQSIGVLSSVVAKHTEAVGYAFAVIMIMFLLSNMYELFDEEVQGIRYISVFTYFRPVDLLIDNDTSGILRDIIILSVISIGCVSLAAVQFKKKDIPV